MNGYAAYIWPAYGVVFGVLTMNLVLIKRQRNRLRKRLEQWLMRQNNDACT
ncbi:MAG TPA: heme exporter protein CcmD [Legionella sp.]|nr:heme exporter protein CcmD [Legionella sp.]